MSDDYGRFRVIEEVARGGMGVILRAYDDLLRRNLALKVLHAEDRDAEDTRSTVLSARFRAEAQVTGQLEHPGVVPIHELGQDESGRPFFAMRLVKGRHFGDVIDFVHAGHDGWTQTRTLGVLLKVCEAVAFAHSKGVVHRDLKPANVMVGRYGEVYVMDWGLAKVLDGGTTEVADEDRALSSVTVIRTDRGEGSDSETIYGDVVGTPSFMPPEQALGKIDEVGAQTDVYALGAILYTLLAGRPPYVEEGSRVPAHLLLKWVVDGPPRPVEEVAPRAHGELVAICEKAMAREPGDRYESALALAEDLRAYLEGRVVHAYEGGALAELKKWIARNRGTALATAAAVLAVLGGLSAVYWIQAGSKEALAATNDQLGDANAALETTIADLGRANADLERARDAADANAALAEERRREAILQSYTANLHAAANALEVAATEDAWANLQACPEELRGWEWNHLDLRADPSLTVLGPVEARLIRVDWSPDGRLLAAAGGSVVQQGRDYDVRLWDAETGELLHELAGHQDDVTALSFSPGGARLASAGNDGRVKLWDPVTGEELLDAFAGFCATGLSFFPDGERVAVSTLGGTVRVLDLATGAPVVDLECGAVARSVLVLPGGERLAAGLEDDRVQLWDVRRRVVEEELDVKAGSTNARRRRDLLGVTDLAADRDGSRIALTSGSYGAFVWEPASGRTVHMLGDHGPVSGVAFHPTGLWIATASHDHTVTFWDPDTGVELEQLLGHDWIASDLDFSPDGDRLVSCAYDGTLRIWDGQPGSVVTTLQGALAYRPWAFTLAWSPDGSRLAWRPLSEVVQVTDAHTGELLGKVDMHRYVIGVGFAPDGETLRVLDIDGVVETLSPEGSTRFQLDADVEWGAFHPSGLLLVTCRDVPGGAWRLDVWDVESGEKLQELVGHEDEINVLVFGRGNDLLYTGSEDTTVRVWDLATGELVNAVKTAGTVADLALLPGPDGESEAAFVACTGDQRDKFLRLYDLATGSVLRELRCSSPPARLDVSPDGERIAVAALDGGVALLHPVRGELVRLRGHPGAAFHVMFSPNGLKLASLDYTGIHRIWDTVHPRERTALRGPALERRTHERAARGAYAAALARFVLPELAEVELASAPSLEPAVRDAAVALARRSFIDYEEAFLELLAVAVDPDRTPAEYERVVAVVERSGGLLNDQPAEDALVATALARLGRYDEALRIIEGWEDRNVFAACTEALCTWHLGRHEEARAKARIISHKAPVLGEDGSTVVQWARYLREIERTVGIRE